MNKNRQIKQAHIKYLKNNSVMKCFLKDIDAFIKQHYEERWGNVPIWGYVWSMTVIWQ